MTRLKRFLAYAKLMLAALLAVFLVLTVAANYGNKTNVWFVRQFEGVPTLWLLAVTAVVSIVGFWVLLRLRGMVRQVREVRAERLREQQLAQQQILARELAAQERRIDEKLRQSVSAPDERPPPS
jgi:ABC-type microcin C transport system permease subunit YejE